MDLIFVYFLLEYQRDIGYSISMSVMFKLFEQIQRRFGFLLMPKSLLLVQQSTFTNKTILEFKKMILSIKTKQNDSQTQTVEKIYEFDVSQKINHQNSQYVEAINLWGRRKSMSTIIMLPMFDLSSLRYLNIGNSNLSAKSCKLISQIVAASLQDISLSENEIGDEGTKHFCKGKWVKLIKINLSKNSITEEGLNHFLRIHAPSLNWIHLAQNKIVASEILKLTLMNSSSINHLQLQGNLIEQREKPLIRNFYERKFILDERSINL